MTVQRRPHFSSPALAGEARERSESGRLRQGYGALNCQHSPAEALAKAGGGKSASPDESYELRQRERQSKPFARKLRKRMTDAEVILWSRLRREQIQGFRFRRQQPLGPFIADFACVSLRLLIEVDGETHSTPGELAYDKRRRAYFTDRGWREIRVSNEDVYKRLDAVLDLMWRECRALASVRTPGPADV